jgi:hypothetical protein
MKPTLKVNQEAQYLINLMLKDEIKKIFKSKNFTKVI